MIKNRTTQLIFQTAYCTLGILGIIASFGIFNYEYNSDFYVYITNLGNYLCVGIMFIELIDTIKKNKNQYVTTLPVAKFAGLITLINIFLMFNFMLAATREAYLNFRINSVLFHIVLPIMYVIDWILFYEHKKIKWYYPLVSSIMPTIYLVFIFTRAWLLDFNPQAPSIYPYFFLNINELGLLSVIKWVAGSYIAFFAMGYILIGLDKILKSRKK